MGSYKGISGGIILTERWKEMGARFQISNRGRVWDGAERCYLDPKNSREGTYYVLDGEKRLVQGLMRKFWDNGCLIRFGPKWHRYIRHHNRFCSSNPVPRFSQVMRAGKQEWGYD